MESDKDKEFNFTREDFDYLRKIVTDTTGILADEDKYTMYYSRLARRVRNLGLKNFAEYRHFLNSNRESESIELVNSVTTNLTSFFRENHHFQFLTNTFIPELKKTSARRIRIWSAGCSSGEEAYSIAITLAQALPDYKSWDIKILATDIDSNVLKKASAAEYESSRVSEIDDLFLKRYFKKSQGSRGDLYTVNQDIREMIVFRQLNLLNSWPIHDKMDCIFCRNVVIYFDKPTKNKLVERYADQLVNDGYLFMGHSESLFKTTDRFKSLNQTVYQKVIPERSPA